MKVVYMFLSGSQGLAHLIYKILPQLEAGTHGSKIVGMCFFDESAGILDHKHPIGAKLAQAAKKNNIVLMKAEMADLVPKVLAAGASGDNPRYLGRIKPTECALITVQDGEQVACFPDLYTALGCNRPDHVISI